MAATEPTLIHHFLENSARALPDKCALVQDDRRATYAEIDAAANHLATWLSSQGVDPGDRVVILLGNGLEYAVSYYGILKAGAVAVPLNPELKALGLEPILESLEPKMIFLSERQRKLVGDLDLLSMGVRFLAPIRALRAPGWPAPAVTLMSKGFPELTTTWPVKEPLRAATIRTGRSFSPGLP